MKNNNKLSYTEVLLIFLAVLLFASCSLVLWAYMFTGEWYAVDFQNEFGSTLIFSATATIFIITLRYLAPGRAKKYMAVGMGLVAFEGLLELPLKKFVLAYPAFEQPIGQWFFLFGLAEFIGLVAVLAGFNLLLSDTKKHYDH